MRFALSVVLALAFTPSTSLACGPDSDCEIGARHYRIAMPEAQTGTVGAIVFAHGYRGSARGVMRNMGLRRMVAGMGLALIAPKSARDDWDIPGAPSDMASTGAAEMAYFEAVIADATARFGIDPDRVMMSGFSAGGMVTWELACQRPDLFAGFAAVSGTFWGGPPASCVSPASVIHIHGTTDRTVPLAGRPIGPTKQGDVSDVLAMYRAAGAFGTQTTVQVNNMSCARQDNSGGNILEFCTFDGGHSFSRSYLSYAWERLRAAGKV